MKTFDIGMRLIIRPSFVIKRHRFFLLDGMPLLAILWQC